MPRVEIVFYLEEDDSVPALEWIERMARRDRRIAVKCQERIERLAELGHDLRRPDADFLRDGIYELRVRWSNVNYRLLYFFFGRTIAVLAGGLTKEASVPEKDIDQAIVRRKKYESDPKAHTYQP